ncbi:MAG: prepilin-type N-terminal cleavage/methylation domain-containing protein [Chitinispirillia bacterium]|nr:prepilin-type N-terminal cleavage/methylation domain-containing protein [Chitinispirillia bacterium]
MTKKYLITDTLSCRNTAMRAEHARGGFTLVEVIVVVVLAAVLVMGGYAVFRMYTNTARETSANLRMQRQAEGLVEEIARRTRGAAFVFRAPETPVNIINFDDITIFNGGNSTDSRVNEIAIHDGNMVTHRFRFNDVGNNIGVAQVDDMTGTGWRNFTIGGDPADANSQVRVILDESWFGIWWGRGQVDIKMKLKTVANNGNLFTLDIQRGAFRCRNFVN